MAVLLAPLGALSRRSLPARSCSDLCRSGKIAVSQFVSSAYVTRVARAFKQAVTQDDNACSLQRQRSVFTGCLVMV